MYPDIFLELRQGFVNRDLYALGSVTSMSMKTRPAEVSKRVAQGR